VALEAEVTGRVETRSHNAAPRLSSTIPADSRDYEEVFMWAPHLGTRDDVAEVDMQQQEAVNL